MLYSKKNTIRCMVIVIISLCFITACKTTNQDVQNTEKVSSKQIILVVGENDNKEELFKVFTMCVDIMEAGQSLSVIDGFGLPVTKIVYPANTLMNRHAKARFFREGVIKFDQFINDSETGTICSKIKFNELLKRISLKRNKHETTAVLIIGEIEPPVQMTKSTDALTNVRFAIYGGSKNVAEQRKIATIINRQGGTLMRYESVTYKRVIMEGLEALLSDKSLLFAITPADEMMESDFPDGYSFRLTWRNPEIDMDLKVKTQQEMLSYSNPSINGGAWYKQRTGLELISLSTIDPNSDIIVQISKSEPGRKVARLELFAVSKGVHVLKTSQELVFSVAKTIHYGTNPEKKVFKIKDFFKI